jgi:Ca2+-transporting ATPase
VIDALKLAQAAGVRTVMITGDHKLTALAIAEQLGLANQENEVMTGTELSAISDEELAERLDALHVFARVNPEQKLRLVKLFQQKYNAKVAVTGDGVNDAPAIKAGDIGVAMGIEGTDVTREVADLVLQDDNYATIVSAVREGRIIFTNLVKFIRYLISCNISEIFVVFFAILLGYPSPLLPIQLLWVNLVTDGLPALALGMDAPELDVMKTPPRNIDEGILTKHRWLHMALEGLVIGMATLVAFIYTDQLYGDDVARTVAFSTLSIAQLVHALNNRSEKFSIFRLGLRTNTLLLVTILISLGLQALVIYTPTGNTLLKAVPLPLYVLDIVLLCAFLPLFYVEIRKLVTQMRHRV